MGNLKIRSFSRNFYITEILVNPEYHNWTDVINLHQEQVKIQEKESTPGSVFTGPTEEEIQLQEIKKKNNRKKTGLLMGKLHDDMMFLDKIANHPALQKNILILKDEDKNGKASSKDIDKVWKIYWPLEVRVTFYFERHWKKYEEPHQTDYNF